MDNELNSITYVVSVYPGLNQNITLHRTSASNKSYAFQPSG